MRLEIANVHCGYGSMPVIDDVSLILQSGEAVYLLGPNGSGKTTLFKAILGLLPLQHGNISIDGRNISGWPRRRLARKLAYVPQAHTPPFPFTVRDVVLTARAAHLGMMASPDKNDIGIADAALDALGILALSDARYTEISGGERQLVLIARAVAQETEFLVMDEPTSNLDFGNQVRVLRKIRELAERGFGLLITTHAPDHAFFCATQVALLHKGKLITSGKPQEVMTQACLQAAYGVALKIVEIDANLRVCVPEMN
jgi:iron complex transport system ATP-binding protein